jgi:hypothetical protein
MNEQSSVVFRVPDFVHDGVTYSDIEVIVEMDSIRDTVELVKTLERSLVERGAQ